MEFGEQTISYKGKVVFIKLNMPFFNRTLKHQVDQEACFMFVNQGAVNVRAPLSHLELNPSKAMLAKCLNYFFEPSSDKESCKEGIEALGIFLYPSLVKDIFDFDTVPTAYSIGEDVQQVKVDLLLENFKNSLKILLDNPDLADEELIKNKLKEFVMLMVKSKNAPSQLDFLSALFQPAHIAFKSIIKQNLYANLSLDELAALTHLSLSSFKRKFKEVFEESPKKYLNKKKIEKAAELLKNSNERISDIAFDVGYDSLATFNRNFTSHYGTTPTLFRLNQNEHSLS